MTVIDLTVKPLWPAIRAVSQEHKNAVLVRLTPNPQVARTQAGVDVALLLDKSHSMTGPPLENVIRSIGELSRRFRTSDRVVAIAFAKTTMVIHALSNQHVALARWADPAHFNDNVKLGYLTNMADALKAAAGALGAAGGRSRRILLLTDGVPDDKVETLKAAEAAVQAGIGITCLGFGEYDEPFMGQIAALSHDSVWPVNDPVGIGAYFDDRVRAIQRQVAENVRVQVQFVGNHLVQDSFTVHPTVRWNGKIQVSDERRWSQQLPPVEDGRPSELLINITNVPHKPGRRKIAEISAIYDVPTLKLKDEVVKQDVFVEYGDQQGPVDNEVKTRYSEAEAERHRVLGESALANGSKDAAVHHFETVKKLAREPGLRATAEATVKKLRGGEDVSRDDLQDVRRGTQKKMVRRD